jgi:hypothetical protein
MHEIEQDSGKKIRVDLMLEARARIGQELLQWIKAEQLQKDMRAGL